MSGKGSQVAGAIARTVERNGNRRDPRVAAATVSLLLAVAVVFGRAAAFEFLNYDDNVYVVSNPIVRGGLTLSGILAAVTSLGNFNWHPLTWISHMVDVQLFGMQAGAHHVVNVAWHAANGALIFLVLRGLTGSVGRSAFAAGLFALHPLRVESVAWVAERKDVLSAFFGLAAVGSYLFFARRPSPGRYLATALLLALGLAAKPMLVTLPFALVLLDRWPLGRFPARGEGSPWARSFTGKVPLLLLAAVAAGLTLVAQHRGGAIATLQDNPLADRFGNAAVSAALYLVKTLWPSGLAVFYPYRAPTAAQVIPALLLLAALTWLAVAWSRSRPWFLAGWLWYLVTLLPVIGIVQVGDQARADRYTYIPSIGVSITLAWILPDLLRHRQALRRRLPSAALGVLAVLGVLAWRQTGFWKDSKTLMEHTLAVTSGNATAHNNLGVVLLQEKSFAEAVPHLEKAVRLSPRNSYHRFNLGAALLQNGDPDGAIRSLGVGLEISPEDASAQMFLGKAYLAVDRPREAALHLETALRLRPDFPEARYHLEIARRRVSASHLPMPAAPETRPVR